MLDKETLEIHERMRKFFKIRNSNLILIEFVENLKTSSGIYMAPSSEEVKSFAHPVVCVPENPGDQIKNITTGMWLVLRPNNINIFKMYNRKFAIISDYEIMMEADMSYIKDEEQFKKEIKNTLKSVNN